MVEIEASKLAGLLVLVERATDHPDKRIIKYLTKPKLKEWLNWNPKNQVDEAIHILAERGYLILRPPGRRSAGVYTLKVPIASSACFLAERIIIGRDLKLKTDCQIQPNTKINSVYSF